MPARPARLLPTDLLHRQDGGLDLDRARSRTSAYVYGNITALATVVAVDAGAAGSVLVVLVTGLATFVAHVLADVMGARLGPDAPGSGDSGSHRRRLRQELGHELRDAEPVATSGAVPAVLLLLGATGVLPVGAAQALAVAVLVARLAATGLVVERLSGRPPSAAAVWAGIALAGLGALVAVVKAVVGH